MKLVQIPLTPDPYQEKTIDFAGQKIRLTLRFNSLGRFWAMDVFDLTKQKPLAQGVSLVFGVPLLHRTSLPYQFWLNDESPTELDPMTVEDLSERCSLYIQAREENETIRT